MQGVAQEVIAAEKEMKANYTAIERKQAEIDRMNKVGQAPLLCLVIRPNVALDSA